MNLLPKTPKFWSRKSHPLSYLLAPFGRLYGFVATRRFARVRPYRSKLPVICIGNFTMGGGGKTPLALEICCLLQQKGHRPVFLTRGYGGETKGPHLVEARLDSAQTVGDEALLLRSVAPVVVSADRGKGARLIEKLDATIILMDDGFQNPFLRKDFSLVVVDGGAGLGNGKVFPAGPLRMPLDFQLPKADALLISGPVASGDNTATQDLQRVYEGEIFRADLMAKGDVNWLNGARICAVTGIARPDKFYGTIEQYGGNIVQRHDHPDHYMFTERDAQNLLDLIRLEEVMIVMTQKDWVRLPPTGARGRLRQQAKILHVELRIEQADMLIKRLERVISSAVRDSA